MCGKENHLCRCSYSYALELDLLNLFVAVPGVLKEHEFGWAGYSIFIMVKYVRPS